jgi:hypothetical protein
MRYAANTKGRPPADKTHDENQEKAGILSEKDF